MALAQMAHHQACQRALGLTGVIQPLVRLCFTSQSPAVLTQMQDQYHRGGGNYTGMRRVGIEVDNAMKRKAGENYFLKGDGARKALY